MVGTIEFLRSYNTAFLVSIKQLENLLYDICLRGSPIFLSYGNLPNLYSLMFYSPLSLDDIELIFNKWPRKKTIEELIYDYLDFLANDVVNAYEKEGLKEASKRVFFYTRVLPLEWLLSPESIMPKGRVTSATRRYLGLLTRLTQHEHYTDFHVHLFSSPRSHFIWLMSLHPLSLKKLYKRVKGMIKRKSYSLLRSKSFIDDLITRQTIILYYSLSTASYNLAEALRSVKSHQSKISHRDASKCPRSPLEITPYMVESAWNKAGFPLSYKRNTNVFRFLLEAESKIKEACHEHGSECKKFFIYLAMRWLFHITLSSIYKHPGLSYFKEIYKIFTIPIPVRSTGKGRPKRAYVIQLLGDSLSLPETPLNRVWIKASAMDKENLIILEKLIKEYKFKANDKLAIQLTLIKKASCEPASLNRITCYNVFKGLERAYQLILNVLRRQGPFKRLSHLVEGFDVAGPETIAPNWPFIQLLRSLADEYRRYIGREPVLSFHAGEDYETALSGLRRIYEAIELLPLKENDRIGHGLALASKNLNVREYIRAMDLLADYSFEFHVYSEGTVDPPSSSTLLKLTSSFERLSGAIFDRRVDPLAFWDAWKTLHQMPLLPTFMSKARLRGWAKANLESDVKYIVDHLISNPKVSQKLLQPLKLSDELKFNIKERVRTVRSFIKKVIIKRNIKVEVCPTSNAMIMWIEPYNHPLLKDKELKNNIVIGSDNPGLIGTDITIEFLHVKASSR